MLRQAQHERPSLQHPYNYRLISNWSFSSSKILFYLEFETIPNFQKNAFLLLKEHYPKKGSLNIQLLFCVLCATYWCIKSRLEGEGRDQGLLVQGDLQALQEAEGDSAGRRNAKPH
jgi:hypothetical protein